MKNAKLRVDRRRRTGVRGREKLGVMAKVVGISERISYESLRFHRTFPILHARAELTWNHYRTLMKIPSDGDRYLFGQKADRQGWSSRELPHRSRPVLSRR